MKFFQENYQKLIHRDTDDNAEKSIRGFFPWFLAGFFLLQIGYYFYYFHGRIDKVMRVLKNYHIMENQILIRPRIVAINYDHFILFLFYIFVVIVFMIFSLVAFDISQRNKVIRQLKNQIRRREEKSE